MRQIGFLPADEIIDKLRELHAPVEHYTELHCEGCSTGFEGEEPDWPCRTAVLVYSLYEQNQITEAARWLRKWSRQMQHRNPSLERLSWQRLIFPNAWVKQTEAYLGDEVLPPIEFQANTVTLKVSKELLEDT